MPSIKDYQKQYCCVERELVRRERVYPRLVAEGTFTRERATDELNTMRAVLATVERILFLNAALAELRACPLAQGQHTHN